MEFEGNVCQKTSVEFSDQENANGWDDQCNTLVTAYQYIGAAVGRADIIWYVLLVEECQGGAALGLMLLYLDSKYSSKLAINLFYCQF